MGHTCIVGAFVEDCISFEGFFLKSVLSVREALYVSLPFSDWYILLSTVRGRARRSRHGVSDGVSYICRFSLSVWNKGTDSHMHLSPSCWKTGRLSLGHFINCCPKYRTHPSIKHSSGSRDLEKALGFVRYATARSHIKCECRFGRADHYSDQ